nr:hypothetical protein [Methanoculleus bourgensis]
MLIPLVTWNNLLKRLNSTKEPFNGTALLVEFRIEPDRSPSFWLFPGSLVDWDIGLDSPVPVVLTDFPCIVGCICGEDRGTILRHGNLKCIEGWIIEPRIMDICRCNCADKRETVPIDQSTQFVSVYLFIAIIAGRSLFFAEIALVSVAQSERSIFRIAYPDRSRSRKIAWYTPFSHNSRWYR